MPYMHSLALGRTRAPGGAGAPSPDPSSRPQHQPSLDIAFFTITTKMASITRWPAAAGNHGSPPYESFAHTYASPQGVT